MIVWDWLSEINLMNTACVMTNESSKRFCDSDYNKHLPQKLLKPFLIDIIETHYIDVFLVPVITKFQLAAGSVLCQLKKKYPHIKIIVIGFNGFDSNFSGEYLHIGWRLRGDATRYVDTASDIDEPCDLVKKEIIEYIYSLDTVLITEDLDIGYFNNHWKLERPSLQTNPIENFQTLLQAEECATVIDDDALEDDNSIHENAQERRRQIKRIKRKIDSTLTKVLELSAQLAIENALLDNYRAELQRLEGEIDKTPEPPEPQTEIKDTDEQSQTEIKNAENKQSEHTNKERDIHTGLYDKFVLWPIGYCRYHSCVLDDVDVNKRKCVLRRGRAGICRHFDFVDEHGNVIEINKELYARRKSHRASHNANIETPTCESECEQEGETWESLQK